MQVDLDRQNATSLPWTKHVGRISILVVVLLCVAMAASVLLALAPDARASVAKFRPTADTYVDATRPNRPNGRVRSLPLTSSPLRRGYLRFDLRRIEGTIVDATLRLHVNGRSGGRFAVRRVAPGVTWSERRTAYASRPAPKGRPLRSRRSRRGWVSIGVKSRVAVGRLAEFVLTGSPAAVIASRESSRPPWLVVEFADAPADNPWPLTPPTLASPSAPGTPAPVAPAPAVTPAPTVTAPVVALSGPTTVAEGTAGTYRYSVTDPSGSSALTVTEDCGVNAQKLPDSAPGSFDCLFPDGPVGSAVRVSAENGDGGAGSDRIDVAVTNVPPTLTSVAGQRVDAGADAAVALGSFSDSNQADGPWAVEIDWGDGSEPTTFNATSTGSLGSPFHTYARGGTYVVTTAVTDKDGGTRTEEFDLAVTSATLRITQDAQPDGSQDFTYAADGLPGFTLDDDGDADLAHWHTLHLLPFELGRRTLTQTPVAGWSLAEVNCTDPDVAVDLQVRRVSIDIAEGDAVECAFVNRKDATLTVIQDAQPDADREFRFATDGTRRQEFTLNDPNDEQVTDRASFTFTGSEFGQFVVTQGEAPGWPLTEVRCSGDNDYQARLDERKVELDVEPGEQIVCHFANRWSTTPIPGIFPETSTNIGPLIDGAGNLYTVTEVSNTLFRPAIRKSRDAGRTWTEVDAGNRPTVDDLESVSLVQDGSLVHMLHQRTGYRVFYNSFNTSDAPMHPDTWRTRNQEVFPATPGPEDQSASLVARGDGTLVAFYQASLTQHAYKVRSAEGVWGPQTIVDTSAGKKFSQIQVVKALRSDRVHIVYKDSTDQTIMYRTLDEGNVLGPVQTIGTGVSTRIHALGNHAIVATDHDGTERVYVAWTRQSDKHLVGTAIEDGVPGDVETISAHPVYENPDSVVSFAAVSSLAAGPDGDVYALYSDGPDDNTGEHDLWYATRSRDGTWDTPAKALDSTDVVAISANVYTHSPANGGGRVLGAVFDVETGIQSEGAVNYTEVALSATG